MVIVELCEMPYTRPRSGATVLCTFIKGHPGSDHSWRAVALEDSLVEEDEFLGIEGLPTEVSGICAKIAEGGYDQYLEILLAFGHDRKRALRGTPGFPRRKDRHGQDR